MEDTLGVINDVNGGIMGQVLGSWKGETLHHPHSVCCFSIGLFAFDGLLIVARRSWEIGFEIAFTFHCYDFISISVAPEFPPISSIFPQPFGFSAAAICRKVCYQSWP